MTTDPTPTTDATPPSDPEPEPQPSRPAPVIVDNVEERRYEARVDGELAGWVEYGRVEGRIVALHTEVPPEFGGRGIASALVRRVLDDARSAGRKVTPRCPFFVAHFERHPEDADLNSRKTKRDGPEGAPKAGNA
jgi:predicted GNAT family acetyltransferase